LIYSVIRFINAFDFKQIEWLEELETPSTSKVLSEYFLVEKQNEIVVFFEFLQIQPIAFNVTFQSSPSIRARMSNFAYNPMELVLSALGTALGSVQGAPIRLNGRTFEHVRGSITVIVTSLAHYYKSQLISEAYKVVGSFEFLGNPVGLVSNLGAGVKDFFYYPSQGIVESPEKFGIGLAKGSLSLVKGAISGIFNTFGNITGSASKGLAMLSVSSWMNIIIFFFFFILNF
jgi:vacuolar protein sorting-associated protein 13A/C